MLFTGISTVAAFSWSVLQVYHDYDTAYKQRHSNNTAHFNTSVFNCMKVSQNKAETARDYVIAAATVQTVLAVFILAYLCKQGCDVLKNFHCCQRVCTVVFCLLYFVIASWLLWMFRSDPACAELLAAMVVLFIGVPLGIIVTVGLFNYGSGACTNSNPETYKPLNSDN